MVERKDEHVDEYSGVATTGHEWDGIRELNQPLPRWWLWILYATIVWSIGYWIIYPSWPLITTHVGGVIGWTSRGDVAREVEKLEAMRAPMVDRLAAADFDELAADAELFDFTLAFGKAAFGDNCAPCHGSGGGGAPGYPNLIDDDWLWGGTVQEIEQTIAFGIRSDHDDTRLGDMPAFGLDEMLESDEILAVADYVRASANLETPADADLEAGAELFADNCAACHGDDRTGNSELGAPNLADAIWLHGSDRDKVLETIRNGRGNSMPAWQPRLGSTTVKALATYVHAFGGGA
jgi:cytochrome c oxidase cbb3-type subunit 3